jgi:hypothetical protein
MWIDTVLAFHGRIQNTRSCGPAYKYIGTKIQTNPSIPFDLHPSSTQFSNCQNAKNAPFQNWKSVPFSVPFTRTPTQPPPPIPVFFTRTPSTILLTRTSPLFNRLIMIPLSVPPTPPNILLWGLRRLSPLKGICVVRCWWEELCLRRRSLIRIWHIRMVLGAEHAKSHVVCEYRQDQGSYYEYLMTQLAWAVNRLICIWQELVV